MRQKPKNVVKQEVDSKQAAIIQQQPASSQNPFERRAIWHRKSEKTTTTTAITDISR